MSDYRLTGVSLKDDHLFNATLTFRDEEYNVEVVSEGPCDIHATKVSPPPEDSDVDEKVLAVIAVGAVKNVRFDMRERTYDDL